MATSTAVDTSPGPSSRPSMLSRLRGSKVPLLLVVFVAAWAVASQFTSQYTIPRVTTVAEEILAVLTTAEGLENLATTLLRVGVGLVCAFAVGLGLGLLMGTTPRTAPYLLPPIRFVQGIPSLSWVIIAVIWFSDVELRIWFVMVLVTLPGFALQTYDSYRGIPAELQDMGRSFRPSRWAMFREITLPAIAPDVFTAWKVNLGLGIRMVLIAELVGATVGVGAQLLSAQQLFDMAAVVAWTLLLAVCMLILQGLVELIEKRVLRYRPGAEHTPAAEPTGPAAGGSGRPITASPTLAASTTKG
jgi:NitT/TauT family transport system permease protein